MTSRALAIRLQAMGDVVITLPYLNDLKRRRPAMELDFLTREETEAIPKSLDLFDNVYAVGGGRHFKRQCLSAAALLPRLILRRYDVVLDLQNSEISRWLTRALRPRASCRFDKVSPRPAGERTRRAIQAAGLGPVEANPRLVSRVATEPLLASAGWRPEERLVVLNPAGAFASRNWPLDSYVGFGRALQTRLRRPMRFLVLGVNGMRPKAEILRRSLGDDLLDLVGRTTPDEAFALVQRADLVLSEDSGLMHMAWVSGVPTLALFGSSRGDWSRPLGPHTLCLDSGDLDCGFCMEPECRFGDVHCLTRHDPERVAELAFELLQAGRRESA